MTPLEEFKKRKLSTLEKMKEEGDLFDDVDGFVENVIDEIYSCLPKKRECALDNLILRGYNCCIDEFNYKLKSKE